MSQGIDKSSKHHQIIRAVTTTPYQSMMPKTDVEEYGWTAVPRDRTNVPTESKAKTSSIPVNFEEIWPKTERVSKAQAHVKQQLPQETYNHSLRVYCYGHTIVTQHFPDWIAVAKDKFCTAPSTSFGANRQAHNHSQSRPGPLYASIMTWPPPQRTGSRLTCRSSFTAAISPSQI